MHPAPAMISISAVPDATSLNRYSRKTLRPHSKESLRVSVFEKIKQRNSSGLEVSCVLGNNGKSVFERGRGYQ